MTKKLVVIGNGMAPGRVLDHLFDKAPGAYQVTIFNAEPRVNYDRIMLSPVLSGEKAYEDIIIHDDAWYEQHGVTRIRARRSWRSTAPTARSSPTTAPWRNTTSC